MSNKKKPVKSAKLTKSQVRSASLLADFYRNVHEYSLRKEAYAIVLEKCIKLQKQS